MGNSNSDSIASNGLKDIGGISISKLAEQYATPSFIYNRETISKQVSELNDFPVIRFAQKACPNIAILALMRNLGVVVDAVSAGEIHRALRAGYAPGQSGSVKPGSPDIVYTADIFDRDALELVQLHNLAVNCGSVDMIGQLGEVLSEAKVTLRINPGFGHGHSQKTNTGGELSKHGIWHGQIEECFAEAKKANVHIHGLHMHIGSGTDFEHLAQVCGSMVSAAKRYGSQLEVFSTGGGLPIPYRSEQKPMDTLGFYELWKKTQAEIEAIVGHPVSMEVEPGRYLVAESGYLLCEIRSVKKQGNMEFYLVDAGFNDLVRPAMYGAYHEIDVIARDGRPLGAQRDVIVAGPLCESGDVFTQEDGGVVATRSLPGAKVGDYLVIRDAGAYGAAMSSNYNTRRLAAEVMVHAGKSELIRERQSFESILQFERIPSDL